RLANDPTMHVYHYAPYEPTALKRLAGRYATRENEIDRLLRGGVLVDLYQVVRQGIRVSQESYSIRKLEPLYMAGREGAITDAGSSVVAYESWLETGDPALLRDIEDYNRQDCESTWLLRNWLEDRRGEAEGDFGKELPRPEPRSSEPDAAQVETESETQALVARLLADVPEAPTDLSVAKAATQLLAHLLDWHRREARPQWWAYYARLAMTDDELLEDSDAIADLAYEGIVGEVAKSHLHRYRFPPEQDHKIGVGDTALDPRTEKSCGTVVFIDSAAGVLDLKRGKTSSVSHPKAVVPRAPLETGVLRRSLFAIGAWVADHGIEGDGPYRAVRDL